VTDRPQAVDLTGLLGTPYASAAELRAMGGYQLGVGIDCLGVAKEISGRRGIPPPDMHRAIVEACESGDRSAIVAAVAAAVAYEHDPASPLRTASGWRAVARYERVVDGDVLWQFAISHRPGVYVIANGLAWTANPAVGVYCVDVERADRVGTQAWRWEPTEPEARL